MVDIMCDGSIMCEAMQYQGPYRVFNWEDGTVQDFELL